MKVVLIGADGQLGTDLVRALVEHVDLRPLSHADIEIIDHDSIERALATHRPDLVVNTAAYNRVDDAEDQPAVAFAANTVGPQLLARACRRWGARLLHLSTDYVFSGDTARPWTERDTPHPVNLYGVSKLAGELAVQAACPESYIVRVSGLYGLQGSRGKGGNFVETMLRLQAAGRPIRVVDDQTLGPTSTLDLAHKLRELILAEPPFGTYHMTASGACTWYDFARAIFDLAGLEVDLGRQSSATAGFRAYRPRYSVLANDALCTLGIDQIRPWSAGLEDYLSRRRGSLTAASALGA